MKYTDIKEGMLIKLVNVGCEEDDEAYTGAYEGEIFKVGKINNNYANITRVSDGWDNYCIPGEPATYCECWEPVIVKPKTLMELKF
jgi:hypothetical protein